MTLFQYAEHARLSQERCRLSALVAGTGNGKRRMGYERRLRIVTARLLALENTLRRAV